MMMTRFRCVSIQGGLAGPMSLARHVWAMTSDEWHAQLIHQLQISIIIGYKNLYW